MRRDQPLDPIPPQCWSLRGPSVGIQVVSESSCLCLPKTQLSAYVEATAETGSDFGDDDTATGRHSIEGLHDAQKVV